MVTLTNDVISGPNLHRAGPLALWRFSQHLSAQYEDQKKSRFQRGAPSWYSAMLW